MFLPEIYQRLYRAYGPQGWWPGDGPFEVVIGAILIQSAAWTNVELALNQMKQADCWSLRAIHAMPVDDLAAIIRPSVYFNAKARKLKAFARHLVEGHDGDLSAFLDQELGPLRKELLSIHGIGPETADAILVYAARKPSFVIDSYTRRIVHRVGLLPSSKEEVTRGTKSGSTTIWTKMFHYSTNSTRYWTTMPRWPALRFPGAPAVVFKTCVPPGKASLPHCKPRSNSTPLMQNQLMMPV